MGEMFATAKHPFYNSTDLLSLDVIDLKKYAAFVRERLRFVADHDVWEWTMRPGAGDKREIRRVYLALEREGALAKKWMHPKKRLVVPFYVWRLTGSFAGYWALEAGSKLLRAVKRRLRG